MARHISFFLLLFAFAAVAQTPAKKIPAPKSPPVTPDAAASAPRDFPIDSITVEGQRILTASGIIAASGLKRGMKGDTATFDAARDRLLATGYFETVGYKFKSSDGGNGYDVNFEIQEMQPLYSLRLEALGATAAEVTPYLKAKDPLFTGRIPGTQQVLERTAREIELYLES